MSVSPETAPEDLDQSGTVPAEGRPNDLARHEAPPSSTATGEAEADVETADPARLAGGPR